MNGKMKMMKKNKKSDMKNKRPQNKMAKKGVFHKNIKSKFKNNNANSKEFTYTPENREIPPVEVQFAKKLAANEPSVRDKAIKKLKKWLTSRSDCDKDVSNSAFNKSEMLRLWKGLHYCFWMSDKPLVQEELAEKIASIMHCFKNNDESALLYMQCFLVTLGREWNGIDTHRMDKFMLLTRRMIRQCFVYAAEKEWNVKLTEDISNIFDLTVIGANRNSNNSNMALGFQLHVTDVYLEELAKASLSSESNSKQRLTDELIQMLLRPFINELTWGKEERLSSQIEIRVFDHLIRQSDVAIAYEEDDDDETSEMEDDTTFETDVDNSDTVDEEPFSLNDADPRAGKGDVVLPQLKIDYEKIAKIVLEAGSKKEVGTFQRQRLYRITKKLNHVSTGIYPFALEMSEDGERLIDEKEFEEQERTLRIEEKKAAKRKRSEDKEYDESIRRERKEYKQALKKKMKLEKERENHTVESQSKEADDAHITSTFKLNAEADKATNEAITSRNCVENIKLPSNIERSTKVDKIKKQSPVKEDNPSQIRPQKSGSSIPKITNAEPETCILNETAGQDAKDIVIESNDNNCIKTKKKKKSKKKLYANISNDDMISSSKMSSKNKNGSEDSTEVKPVCKEIEENANKVSDQKATSKAKRKDESNDKCVIENGEKKKSKKKKMNKDHIDKSTSLNGNEPKAGKTKSDKSLKNIEAKDKGSLNMNPETIKTTSSSNTFLVNDEWDEPLKEGETEIFVPSPKFSKKLKESASNKITPSKKKAKEKLSSNEVYGNPSITTPQRLPTPVFIKKSISKSEKKSSAKSIKGDAKSEPKSLTSDSSKKAKIGKGNNAVSKKINFAMSENKCQSLLEIDKSIQQSPNFQPYDAARKPAKGPILKTPPGRGSEIHVTPLSKKKKQTVLYNTMVNSKSKFAARARV